jgi:2-polyprenyl-3-methyl-5-hydroxy-6-metoxy-1,4-benzoquinol methylase
MDRSNGYENIAAQFLARRGNARSTAGIGVTTVRKWARTLPPGAAVIDLGCGSGIPITQVLVTEGLNVCAVDASASLVFAFRQNFPNIPVACEAVEDSAFFARTFDAVLAWGLLFLLSPEQQQLVLQRITHILNPRGRLLFTAPAKPVSWNDVMTGLESRSLGAEEYKRQLQSLGLSLLNEYEDEGQNHYYEATKVGTNT